MLRKTDLRQVKKVAQAFLMLEPELTAYSPIVVKHPFTDSGTCAINTGSGEWELANILDNPKAMQSWRKTISDLIDNAESAEQIHMMLTKSYRFAFLKYAMPHLSKQDFSEYLADAWVNCEAPNGDPNFTQRQMVSLFRKAAPESLMDEDDLQRFMELEETVAVYRGVTSFNAERVRALSWTLDKDTAHWFAHRFGEDGTVYEAQIEKKHILAFFSSRNESEVIVDPKYLMEIEEVQSMDTGLTFHQTM